MNEEILGFDGKLTEAQGWLDDAVIDLEAYNSFTEKYYPEVGEALLLCAESRQRMEDALAKVKHLITATQKMQQEEEREPIAPGDYRYYTSRANEGLS